MHRKVLDLPILDARAYRPDLGLGSQHQYLGYLLGLMECNVTVYDKNALPGALWQHYAVEMQCP